MDKTKNYEKTLPENYVPVMHVDAKNDKKQAQKYMLFAYIPMLVIVPLLCVIANFCSGYNIFEKWNEDNGIIVCLIAVAVNFLYIIPHELTHGITYKLFTGGKLTFGYAVTVAFCGIPDLYIRKKASVTALIMPFIVFTFVFSALTVGLWFIKPMYGIAAGLVLALHIGGCAGDLNWFFMFMTKFKNCDTLRRDTGPEQWLYIPREQAEKYGIAVIDE